MSQRKFFVGGNWKANGTYDSVTKRVAELNSMPLPGSSEIVVSPSFLHLLRVKSEVRPEIQVAAQNAYLKSGAFTGEVSFEMLADLQVHWVILGHSERRAVFGEDDKLVGEKVEAALKHGLSVIACIGETLAEREAKKVEDVITRQMQAIVAKVSKAEWSRMVIAYEPVWAIGTGVTASPEQAQEVHKMIRGLLAKTVSAEIAESTRIIYGGSVKANNCAELSCMPDIDGFLVGGASLTSEFVNICNSGKSKL